MHECPYPGCHRQVAVDKLACRSHWFTVSKPTRDRVWDAWLNHDTAAHDTAVTQAVEEMRTHARNRGWNDNASRRRH